MDNLNQVLDHSNNKQDNGHKKKGSFQMQQENNKVEEPPKQGEGDKVENQEEDENKKMQQSSESKKKSKKSKSAKKVKGNNNTTTSKSEVENKQASSPQITFTVPNKLTTDNSGYPAILELTLPEISNKNKGVKVTAALRALAAELNKRVKVADMSLREQSQNEESTAPENPSVNLYASSPFYKCHSNGGMIKNIFPLLIKQKQNEISFYLKDVKPDQNTNKWTNVVAEPTDKRVKELFARGQQAATLVLSEMKGTLSGSKNIIIGSIEQNSVYTFSCEQLLTWHQQNTIPMTIRRSVTQSKNKDQNSDDKKDNNKYGNKTRYVWELDLKHLLEDEQQKIIKIFNDQKLKDGWKYNFGENVNVSSAMGDDNKETKSAMCSVFFDCNSIGDAKGAVHMLFYQLFGDNFDRGFLSNQDATEACLRLGKDFTAKFVEGLRGILEEGVKQYKPPQQENMFPTSDDDGHRINDSFSDNNNPKFMTPQEQKESNGNNSTNEVSNFSRNNSKEESKINVDSLKASLLAGVIKPFLQQLSSNESQKKVFNLKLYQKFFSNNDEENEDNNQISHDWSGVCTAITNGRNVYSQTFASFFRLTKDTDMEQMIKFVEAVNKLTKANVSTCNMTLTSTSINNNNNNETKTKNNNTNLAKRSSQSAVTQNGLYKIFYDTLTSAWFVDNSPFKVLLAEYVWGEHFNDTKIEDCENFEEYEEIRSKQSESGNDKDSDKDNFDDSNDNNNQNAEPAKQLPSNSVLIGTIANALREKLTAGQKRGIFQCGPACGGSGSSV